MRGNLTGRRILRITCLLCLQVLWAATRSVLPAQADPLEQSFVLPGVAHQYSAPVIAPLVSGSSEKHLVVVSGATVYALRNDGTVLWSYPLPNVNCTASSTQNKVYSTPAVGDLLGNGRAVVVAGYGGFGGTACGGGVVAIDGSSGALLWHYDLKVASKRLRFGTRVHSVFSSPALGDVDGNGTLEVAFGSWDRNIYLLNSDGTLRWYYQAADTVWSSPAVAQLDGLPGSELIIGTDISRNNRLKPPTFNGGFLYAFKGKQAKKKILFRDSSAYLWQSFADQVFYASPIVADLISTSPGPEIAIASGCFFPQGEGVKSGRTLKVYSGNRGTLLASLDIPACSSSHPAVADVNHDGNLDLLFPANGGQGVSGTLYAWTPATNTVLWSVVPSPSGRSDTRLGDFTCPAVADLDGNGSLEVVVNAGAGMSIFSGATGAALTCSSSGCTDGLPNLDLAGALHTAPAVGDLNGDGAPELVGLSAASGKTKVSIWSSFSRAPLEASSPGYQAFEIPWPQSRGDATHRGCASN